jgi:hypothetical protein
MSQVRTCVNHPREETRVACSSCGDPICPRCMRQSAVGQKCPDCARVPRSARALGKPVHYAKAVGAGLLTAAVGGVLLVELLARLPFGFGRLILSGLLGFGVGRVVAWGAQRQTQPPFPHIAVGCAVLGLAGAYSAGYGTPVPTNMWVLLAYAVAGYFAYRGAFS